jgi:antibiotic biosynthesis monooxygenase (ABM) superfamily enzyme
MSAPNANAVKPSSAVTVLVTRRVRADRAQAFERAMDGMMDAAKAFEGHLGGYLVKPEGAEGGAGADPGVYHMVFAFDNETHLAHWQKSKERAHWLDQVKPHAETDSGFRRVPGLEHWFALLQKSPPPRWKVAMVTWFGICPTAWVALTFLAPPLSHWPSFPRVMLLTSLVVIAMTWWVAPTLTRIFGRWLYPPVKDGQAGLSLEKVSSRSP